MKRLLKIFCCSVLLSMPVAKVRAEAVFAGADLGFSSLRYEHQSGFSNSSFSETDTSYGGTIGVRFNRYFAVSLFGIMSGESSFTAADNVLKGKIDYYYYGGGADAYVFLPVSAQTSLIATAGVGNYKIHFEYQTQTGNTDGFETDYSKTGIRFGFGTEYKISDDTAVHAVYRRTEFDSGLSKDGFRFNTIDEYTIGLRWFF